LNRVDALYHAPSGDIKVAWNRVADGKIELMLTIPKGTIAQFQPAGTAKKYWTVSNLSTGLAMDILPGADGIELKEGVYKIR
jgi:hypothetical protein